MIKKFGLILNSGRPQTLKVRQYLKSVRLSLIFQKLDPPVF